MSFRHPLRAARLAALCLIAPLALLAAPYAARAQVNYVVRNATASSTGTGILYDNGTDVGIGTTSPVNLLDLAGSGGIHIATGVPSNTSYALYNNSGTLYWNGSTIGSGGGGSGTVTSSTAGQVAYYQSTGTTVIGTSTITISGGDVGIGTTSPSTALQISLTAPSPLPEHRVRWRRS